MEPTWSWKAIIIELNIWMCKKTSTTEDYLKKKKGLFKEKEVGFMQVVTKMATESNKIKNSNPQNINKYINCINFKSHITTNRTCKENYGSTDLSQLGN